MPRHLPADEVGSALRRGKTVEQFVGLRTDASGSRVCWLEIRPVRDAFEAHRFDVVDHGAPDSLDVYAWVDGDAEQESSMFATPEAAIEFTIKHWAADSLKWVNQGVLQDEYCEAILMRPETEN